MMKRTRMSIEVSERVRALIEELGAETDAESMTEVIRRALYLYALATRAKATGRALIIRDADGTEREVILLAGAT